MKLPTTLLLLFLSGVLLWLLIRYVPDPPPRSYALLFLIPLALMMVVVFFGHQSTPITLGDFDELPPTPPRWRYNIARYLRSDEYMAKWEMLAMHERARELVGEGFSDDVHRYFNGDGLHPSIVDALSRTCREIFALEGFADLTIPKHPKVLSSSPEGWNHRCDLSALLSKYKDCRNYPRAAEQCLTLAFQLFLRHLPQVKDVLPQEYKGADVAHVFLKDTPFYAAL